MIRRILVADRGAFARRIFATCRAIGIETVAVFTEPDADAPYVTEADFAIRLPCSAQEPVPVEALATAVLAAADRCGADAVHPGHGVLAEDPDLAAAVIDAGLTWIGPAPKVLAVLASKPETRALFAGAGLPVLPAGSGPEDAPPPPVMIKPAAGRGGLGLRLVRDPAALPDAVTAARRDAAALFDDPTVVCERYVERARHIEVQVLADAAGTVVPLGERECSIQRHRGAIIHEAPSPAVDPGLRAELFTAAITAVRAVGFVGAAAVEFLLSPGGEFHLLAMRAHLGSEFPTTECVFGVDLVRMQLLVAEGGTLPFAAPPPMRGHAIAVRLAAEDPAYDWRPCPGVIHRMEIPGIVHNFGPLLVPGLRLDAAVTDGGRIHPGQDPVLGTVTAWAPTRHEAARRLATALTQARLHGVTTDRDLLVRVLRHPAYLAGEIDTEFLSARPEVFAPLLSSLDAVRLSCLAAALAGSARRRSAAPAFTSLPAGWRNVPSAPQTVTYEGPTGTLEVAYRFDREGALATWAVCTVGRKHGCTPGATHGNCSYTETDDLPSGDHPAVVVISARPDRVELEVGGVRLVFNIHTIIDDRVVCYVDSSEGSVTLVQTPRFPRPIRDRSAGSLVAPVQGVVGQILTAPGHRVAAGDVVFTVQTPTNEHRVHAPLDGMVSDLWVASGAPVDAGSLLAVVVTAEA